MHMQKWEWYLCSSRRCATAYTDGEKFKQRLNNKFIKPKIHSTNVMQNVN